MDTGIRSFTDMLRRQEVLHSMVRIHLHDSRLPPVPKYIVEFEEFIANMSLMTVDEMRDYGFFIEACDCQDVDCFWTVGWSKMKMGTSLTPRRPE